MYHSLIFEEYGVNKPKSRNTWNHWHLIPSSRPCVAQAAATYKYVDIPGMDGQMDLTDYLIGRPTYSDRSGSFEFYVINDYGKWTERRTELTNFLNGRVMKLVLEDDPNYYYIGRFYMKEWRPGTDYSTVSIEYHVKPYKYDKNGKAVLA